MTKLTQKANGLQKTSRMKQTVLILRKVALSSSKTIRKFPKQTESSSFKPGKKQIWQNQ